MISARAFIISTLFSLVAAEQQPGDLGGPIPQPFVPAQKDLHGLPSTSSASPDAGIPYFGDFEDIDNTQVSKDVSDLTQPAILHLYPASSLPFRPMMSFGCRESTFIRTTLPLETCLSGDYYLNHNMLIASSPVCADGETPIMSYYPQRGCSGSPSWSSNYEGKDIPQYCLWGGHSPKYWSLIFRCGVWPTLIQGADKHVEATPPPAPWPDKPTDAKVTVDFPTECPKYKSRNEKPTVVPVDTCLVLPALSINIQTAAVCPNGKRAQRASFEDAHCGHGTLSQRYGLIDIPDSDIGNCMKMTSQEGKINSMIFWCDGLDTTKPPILTSGPNPGEKVLKLEEPKAKPGSISESACFMGRAPFFTHPKTDTCVDLQTDQMKIYSSGTCANGTHALMVKYPEKGCAGEAVEYVNLSENDYRRCLDTAGVKSFSFFCEGLEVPGNTPAGKLRVKEGGSQTGEGKKGSISQLIVILLLVCLIMLLSLLLSIWAWFNSGVGKVVRAFFARSQGAIAL